jgi:hypothetical protein
MAKCCLENAASIKNTEKNHVSKGLGVRLINTVLSLCISIFFFSLRFDIMLGRAVAQSVDPGSRDVGFMLNKVALG